MNVLDENIIASQRAQLRRWRFPFRQIGYELAAQGTTDPHIIPLLLRLKQPTFFTRDFDFFKSRLCHPRYCIAWLNVRPDQAASFIRRFLGHPEFCTHGQRLGKVVHIHPGGIACWLRGKRAVVPFDWMH
jgi:hypothetical protein